MPEIILENGKGYKVVIDSAFFEKTAAEVLAVEMPVGKKDILFKQLIAEDVDDKLGYAKYKDKLLGADVLKADDYVGVLE